MPDKGFQAYTSVYTAIEYGFFSFLIFSNLTKRVFKVTIIIFSIAFFAFQGYYYLSGGINVLDSLSIGIETIFLFVYIIFLFYEYFNRPTTNFIYNHYSFWISMGILIYLACGFFFNILADHIPKNLVRQFWQLTFIPEFIKNIFFIFSIVLCSKDPESKLTSRRTIPYLDIESKQLP